MSQQNHRRPVWVPDEVDIETPSAARMYDYYLGGSHNFAADRHLAKQAMDVWPDARAFAVANRAFLYRAVKLLAASGIDQFLDLGSGIPTAGNVHEVAFTRQPGRAHLIRRLRRGRLRAWQHPAVQRALRAIPAADLRAPESVLGSPELNGFLDLSRPVAVLLFLVLPFVPEADDPAGIISAYREASAPGSYIAVSHGTGDYRPQAVARARDVYEHASHSMTLRSKAEIETLLSGYELLEPGVIDTILWRPDRDAAPDPLDGDVTRYSMYAAVGRRS